MKTSIILTLLITILVFVNGCSQKTTVVLLPDPDGKVGHVIVANDAGTVNIREAGKATVVKGRDSHPKQPSPMSQADIDANFSIALKNLPPQPTHFLLYFQKNSTKLTTESIKTLPQILQTIANQNSSDIKVVGHTDTRVVGHTDTAGDHAYNMALSKKRAAAVAQLLVNSGLPENQITSTSHGEENLLIKTADDVHERKNRRVEVIVR
ncbi:MAG: OmpA family protein [Desulfobulbaceae bacterium]|nr:OmpA family protein [Desulfobulbaceae bacterium]